MLGSPTSIVWSVTGIRVLPNLLVLHLFSRPSVCPAVFYGSTNPTAAMILFIMFEFVMNVLLLNILIASMTSSFSKITQVRNFWCQISTTLSPGAIGGTSVVTLCSAQAAWQMHSMVQVRRMA